MQDDIWTGRLDGGDMLQQAAVAKVREIAQALAAEIDRLPFEQQVAALNAARIELHRVSPFRNEPVDLVVWVPVESVTANDYNPNKVAPPEMKLLERSIVEDGYTQPVVTHLGEGRTEVVDGFHRSRVARESRKVRERVRGHLPVVGILPSQAGRSNRMAATIRHNRARGTHSIDLMKSIVGELVQAGMSDTWIMKHIGMDADELLRLKQITGIAALFADKDFSRAWARDEADAASYQEGT